MKQRELAMQWWSKMSLEQKFYKTIAANSVLIGDTVDNHPDRLTGSEIEKVYNYHLCPVCEELDCKNDNTK